MKIARLVGVLTALAVLGLSAAYAAGLGPVTSASVGAAGASVEAPPVAITNVDWDVEWEDGGSFRVRVANLTIESTDAGTHSVDVYVALTKDGGLLAPALLQHVTVGPPPGSSFDFNFNGADVPAEDLNDIHVLICTHVSGHTDGVCAAP